MAEPETAQSLAARTAATHASSSAAALPTTSAEHATHSRASSATPTQSGFLPDRIVHLHPTRRCNLACRHCYSQSEPGLRASLDIEQVWNALPVLKHEGYAQLSLSGGEPLLYAELPRLVARARELGLRVTLVTNGLLLSERHDALLDELAAIAISFDGLADAHDRMRGKRGAFEQARAAARRLAAAGRPVAAAISLDREALHDLPELVDLLVADGVRVLQARPLARAGRARELDAGTFCTETDLARLYLIVRALRLELPSDVRLHCDLFPAQSLWQQRDAYAGLLGECATEPLANRPLAELVNPLVITGEGILKPIAYDFDPRYDLGTLAQVTHAHFDAYKKDGVRALQALVGSTLARMRGANGLVDWFDACTRHSETHAALEAVLGDLHATRC